MGKIGSIRRVLATIASYKLMVRALAKRLGTEKEKEGELHPSFHGYTHKFLA